MSRKTKNDVVSNKRNAMKKPTKIAMACPQCMDKPYPEEIEMKEEMVKGIVSRYFCRRCGYQVDAE
jgi:transposase-like protein